MIPVYLHCDGCHEIHNADDIYEFWGNVMHPCGGGIVGQNIFTDETDRDTKAEESRGVGVVCSTDNSVRIYALRYCRTCCARIFKIGDNDARG